MKIGLIGQKLLIDNPAGPEIYTLNTYRALAKTDLINKYIVYFDQKPTEAIWDDISQKNPNFTYKVLKTKLSWTQISLAFELFRDNVDILFTPIHTLPGIHPSSTKIVSMIHGLEYKINKQFEKIFIKNLIHPLILWWVLAFSKTVIVPSQATKAAIVEKKWPFINIQKIIIIPEGVNAGFYKRDEKEISKVREKYHLEDNPYLIFVSTIQPRKNIPRMIKAFSMTLEQNPLLKNYLLLISGKLGWAYQESVDAPEKYCVKDNVRFIGRVPDEDLPVLLSGAEYFINCSLEEGFGIPLLEAMACETPIIVSDIPAFKELGADLPVYVNPGDENDIAEKITSALQTSVTADILMKEKETAKHYTWEKCAEQLITVFNTLNIQN